jgi:cytosine/adenosine deaminase-related metal-dependent hydrolase
MILLKNGTYIDWRTLEFYSRDVLVSENSTKLTFDPSEEQKEAAVTIDCSGLYITKSFGCGHHHAYSALARGMPAPKKSPVNFKEILEEIWWKLDKVLDLETIYYSALVTAMACLKNGVTFIIDHHSSPFAIKGSLNTIKKAFDEVGVGHLLCYEISDRDGQHIAEQGLEETERYLTTYQGLVGLHASFTVSDDTIRKSVELAKRYGAGIHIHTAEAITDQEDCIAKYGKRVVERLSENGILQFHNTILAHCIHLDQHEKGLISGSNVWIAHNAESNMNNSVGEFHSEGVLENIMLGTDGMHSDMLRAAKSTYFYSHAYDNLNYQKTYHRFRNIHNYLDMSGYTGDGSNNLVVLDYDSPTEINSSNFLSHFLFGIESRHIRHVITNGRLLMSNNEILTVKEDQILNRSISLSKLLWQKLL